VRIYLREWALKNLLFKCTYFSKIANNEL